MRGARSGKLHRKLSVWEWVGHVEQGARPWLREVRGRRGGNKQPREARGRSEVKTDSEAPEVKLLRDPGMEVGLGGKGSVCKKRQGA